MHAKQLSESLSRLVTWPESLWIWDSWTGPDRCGFKFVWTVTSRGGERRGGEERRGGRRKEEATLQTAEEVPPAEWGGSVEEVNKVSSSLVASAHTHTPGYTCPFILKRALPLVETDHMIYSMMSTSCSTQQRRSFTQEATRWGGFFFLSFFFQSFFPSFSLSFFFFLPSVFLLFFILSYFIISFVSLVFLFLSSIHLLSFIHSFFLSLLLILSFILSFSFFILSFCLSVKQFPLVSTNVDCRGATGMKEIFIFVKFASEGSVWHFPKLFVI